MNESEREALRDALSRRPLEGQRAGGGDVNGVCEWVYVRLLGFYCRTHHKSSFTNPPTHDSEPSS